MPAPPSPRESAQEKRCAGNVFIVVGDRDLKPAAEALDPANPFDRWFREQNQAILGIDVAEIGAEASERIGKWRLG